MLLPEFQISNSSNSQKTFITSILDHSGRKRQDLDSETVSEK